jgi:hypothetical protein
MHWASIALASVEGIGVEGQMGDLARGEKTAKREHVYLLIL